MKKILDCYDVNTVDNTDAIDKTKPVLGNFTILGNLNVNGKINDIDLSQLSKDNIGNGFTKINGFPEYFVKNNHIIKDILYNEDKTYNQLIINIPDEIYTAISDIKDDKERELFRVLLNNFILYDVNDNLIKEINITLCFGIVSNPCLTYYPTTKHTEIKNITRNIKDSGVITGDQLLENNYSIFIAFDNEMPIDVYQSFFRGDI